MNTRRRQFISGAAAGAVLAVVAGPSSLLAAARPEQAFDLKKLDESLRNLTGGAKVAAGDQRIHIKAPSIAENGAVVPVSVNADMDGVESLSILVENNPLPLTSSYEFHGVSDAYVSTRIKMRETSNVVALVKADGKYYSASKEVKVTIGGCGG